MGGSSLGVVIEALVAVLLAVTIGYCVLVNRKLIQLRSDQSELKSIVRELHAATHQAEQAIAGLRQSAQTADQSLGQQIEKVRALDEQLRINIGKGEVLLTKLAALPRVQEATSASGQSGGAQAQPIRQSAIGLGLLNARRRKVTESAPRSGRDEAAA